MTVLLKTGHEAQVERKEINVFFWLPVDFAKDKLLEESTKQVAQGIQNLASAKNGKWLPVAGEVGLKVLITPVSGVPAGHVLHKAGHTAYLVRDRNRHQHEVTRLDNRFYRNVTVDSAGKKWRRCNLIAFYRVRKPQELWLPDRMAAKMEARGVFKVQGWDTQAGAAERDKAAEELNKEPTKQELEYEEFLDNEVRGPRTVMQVPYPGAAQETGQAPEGHTDG